MKTDFLARMARSDALAGKACGQCHLILGAEVAREMIEAGECEDVVSKWTAEAQALGWEQVLQIVASENVGGA